MAQKWTNRNLPGALHFVTGNVRNRLPVFRREAACLAFFDELQSLKNKRHCKTIAFVLMPDHFHIVINPRDGNVRAWMAAFKSLTARRLIELLPANIFRKSDEENQVWQESFKDLPMWSNWMIWQKINYIHNNPLKARLANSAKDFRWSSFRSFYKLETEEILQVDENWWWEDDVRKLSEAMTVWDKELKEKYKK